MPYSDHRPNFLWLSNSTVATRLIKLIKITELFNLSCGMLPKQSSCAPLEGMLRTLARTKWINSTRSARGKWYS